MSSRIIIPVPSSTVIEVGQASGPASPSINTFRVEPLITSLTGPTSSLASLDTANNIYPLNICVFLPNITTPATYQLVAGTDLENNPFVIRPNDYSGGNQKVWKQRT